VTKLRSRSQVVCVLAGLALIAHAASLQAHAQQAGSARTRILSTVDRALQLQVSGDFAAARGTLERVLDDCGNEADAPACVTLVTYSLAYLHQKEGMTGASARDSALAHAVALYDAVLQQDPEHAGALYNKALAYRSMGAHEWQEPFFQDVARRDPSRRAIYLSMLGDYYMDQRRPDQASRSYREALAVDPDDAGARSGLMEAERARGVAGGFALLSVAEQWQVTSPGDAVDAYRVALDIALSPNGGGSPDSSLADEACIRLVLSHQQLGEVLVAHRGDGANAANDWPPLAEMERFLRSAMPDSAPWWLNGQERRHALAHAALLRGSAAAARRNLELAERFWRAGVEVAERGSATAASIQRELALLYTREPGLDPGGYKFGQLEDEIFLEKSEALISRDLEAAQRFHQTLGLIYAQRRVWQSASARNAITQLEWALRAAEQRAREEMFFQPLPAVHELLAAALDSAGRRQEAVSASEDAVRAYLDVDDIDGATRSAVTLRRLVSSPSLEPLERLIAIRADNTCTATGLDRRTAASGPADFVRRQRFKVLADCIQSDPRSSRAHALAAYEATDTANFTLVGIADARRLERVMSRILRPAGIHYRQGNIESAAASIGRSLPLSLPTETVARWLKLEADDVIAVNVIRVLGPESSQQLRVHNGEVGIDAVDSSLIGRLRGVQGVKSVRFERPSTK
jgi:tetratricopeptide (TPR) repeat protein